MLFLVRHAKAGHRDDRDPDDHARALSKPGREQAELLVEPLRDAGANAPLLASPFKRCLQTLSPLAIALGATVIADDRLAEAQPFEPVLALLATIDDGAVLCSHGDLIPDVIAALQRRGCALIGQPDWRKASVWALTRTNDGSIVSATSWPPPA